MNPALANKILKLTPSSILHPTPKMDTPLVLNTGATIPAIGLGTWQSGPGEVREAVAHAIASGYRHIDTAWMYRNEAEVGEGMREGIKRAGISRADVFLTTKLWCTYHNRVEEALDDSLGKLGEEYVDLYLMHWPVPMNPNGNHPAFPKRPDGSRDIDESTTWIETYKSMVKLLATGKAKAIGVSNCSVKYLQDLAAEVGHVPAVNQVELHPFLPQHDLIEYCAAKGIHVSAYSPLGSTGTRFMNDETVQEIAKKHGASAANVLISYHVARNCSALPKSVTPSRIEENAKVLDLDDEDMETLTNLAKNKGTIRLVYPPFGVRHPSLPNDEPKLTVWQIKLGFPDKEEV
ncbi:aldehyde reductase 1 [Trichodelitschia bisporula]|uniref:Aldehyde reductase 1 n=1 Tax=Trichodelitschia bisporula TaxID=703511 RepID=A0A6G1IAK2_9PEZI|nr:aldehyde reductase 1 [Trichodelitschia bisporula]